MVKGFYTKDGKVRPITIRTKKPTNQFRGYNLSLTDIASSAYAAHHLHDEFVKAGLRGDRKQQLAIKRAIVSAGNKAEVAGNHDVALIYRKAHQDMLLPSKDGLVYRTNAVGKREKIEYDGMYLTKLQEEREYAQKRGWTGEVAKIDKELAKRAKDKTASKRNGIEMGYEKVMQSSIKDEGSDADKYEKMAAQAKAEGRTQDAKVLCGIAKDETRHEKLLKKIEKKTIKFPKNVIWVKTPNSPYWSNQPIEYSSKKQANQVAKHMQHATNYKGWSVQVLPKGQEPKTSNGELVMHYHDKPNNTKVG